MSKKINIIYAEDEPALAQIVKESLETRGFHVILCVDGERALEQFKKTSPDLLVLDVMMPKLDGFSLAKLIRKTDAEIPILFLTAKSQTEDVVAGFNLGGNDYLKKPFSLEELIVRIQNLISKSDNTHVTSPVRIGHYSFDVSKQKLQYKKEKIMTLTHREAQLLFHLYTYKNELLDRAMILNKLWGSNDFFNARSMDVFISKLRKKLKQDPTVQIINVRGFGYKLIC